MKLYGKIIESYFKERIIKLKTKNKYIYVYFQRKDYKDFGPYFRTKPYIFINVKDEKTIMGRYAVYSVTSFTRVVVPNKIRRSRVVFFDIETIKKGVKRIINRPSHRLFLDLEFTMPSLYQTMPHVSEIIQYGMILENRYGTIILKESSLIAPKREYNLNMRTLKFLSLKRGDFKTAISYLEFYNRLKKIMKDYNPKVYCWGRGDITEIERSFYLNKVKPINIRPNHINLMQLIKNYYNIKIDLGLFQTHCIFSNRDQEQLHDALEDASITREVFQMFRKAINTNKKISFE